jgi:hypothetical protein
LRLAISEPPVFLPDLDQVDVDILPTNSEALEQAVGDRPGPANIPTCI